MQYKDLLRARYWDSVAYKYAKDPNAYLIQARRLIKNRIKELRAEASLLEEIADELK